MQSFFEEIEDLKFALQQSTLLNKEYENVLRQMCAQFGLPYPHPERVLDASWSLAELIKFISYVFPVRS